jgi:hypothetical protein
MTEKPVGYILLEAPEAFQDLETGITHETYHLDGTGIGFVIDEEGHDLRFEDMTLHLYKTPDNQLENVYLDLLNMPGAIFNQIGPITGLPVDGQPLKDDEIVHLRLALRPEARAAAETGLQTAPTLGDFFNTAMENGQSVFWDFHSWYTESLMGS